MAFEVKGLDDVMRNLQRELDGIKDRSRTGFIAAGAFIQGEAMAITPVEFGTLVNSAFSVTTPPGAPIVTTIGYTASYAPYVHEMPPTNKFTKPGTGPKFLERPLRDNQQEIINIVRNHGKLP